MRILLVGQAAFAEEVLHGLEAAGDTIAAVVCPPDAGPKPDAVMDTGPILLQRSAPVGPDDTAGSLYYKTLYPLGVRTVLDAVALVREGRAPRVPQDESRASYDPLCRDEHARIDWSRPAAEVHNLIRGCDPQPGAHTVWRGAPLRLYEPRRVEAPARAAPGTVLAIDGDGLTVAARDGAICCARARNGGAKTPAAEVSRPLGLEPGARLA